MKKIGTIKRFFEEKKERKEKLLMLKTDGFSYREIVIYFKLNHSNFIWKDTSLKYYYYSIKNEEKQALSKEEIYKLSNLISDFSKYTNQDLNKVKTSMIENLEKKINNIREVKR